VRDELAWLLDQPAARAVATPQRVLARIGAGGGTHRQLLTQHLFEHHAESPAVRAWVENAVRRTAQRATPRNNDDWRKDQVALAAWSRDGSHVLRPDLIEPLRQIVRYERNSSARRTAIEVLSRHVHLVEDADTLRQQLAEAVLASEQMLRTGQRPAEASQWRGWARGVRRLAATQHGPSAELLRPYLDELVEIEPPHRDPVDRTQRNGLPLLARDVAANAILDLYGDVDTPRASRDTPLPDEAAEQAELLRREAVARRLAGE
jgi:hypothetical protein